MRGFGRLARVEDIPARFRVRNVSIRNPTFIRSLSGDDNNLRLAQTDGAGGPPPGTSGTAEDCPPKP
jgi:hypothetical protein